MSTTSRRAQRNQAFHELYAVMRRQIPGLRIAFKDDPPDSMPRWHRWGHAFARRLVPDYDTRFTTVLYPVVYLPTGTRTTYERDPGRWLATMRHEFIHLLDMQKHPVLMPVTYLLPPMGITGRAYWELRAYTQSMVIQKELGLPLDEAFIERLEELFIGRSYIFMLWPRPLARRVLEHARKRVQDGEIRGMLGASSFWQDFVKPLLRGHRLVA